jgi:membrane protein
MSKAIDFLKGFWKRYTKARINQLASSLAFYSLTSVVPIVALGFWYLSSVGVTQRWLDLARYYIVSHLDFGSGERFVEIFDQITMESSGSSWGWVGLITFLYIAFALLISVGDALDQVLRTREIEIDLSRGMIKTMFRRFLFMIFLPLALGTSSFLMGWIKDDSWLNFIFNLEYFGSLFALPLPWTLDLIVFFLLYLYIPNVAVTPRQALRAALFSTPLYIAGKFGMSYYSTYALMTHKIYGAFAVVPLVMLWIYVAWIIVLAGALFIKEDARTMSRSPQGPKKNAATPSS